MKSKNKINAVGRAGLWFTLCNVLQRGIQFLVTPIYTRLLSTESYGRYSTFLTWCNLFAVIATLSLASGVFNKAMAKFEEDRDNYLSSMIGLATTTTGIAAILYCILFVFFKNKIGLTILQSILMFLCIYFQMIIQLWSARKRYEYQYIGVVIVTVIFALTIPATGIAAFYTLFHSEMGLIVGYTASNVLVGVVLLASIIKKHKVFFEKTYWLYALRFNIPLIPHYLSNIVLGQSDRLMISYFCGDHYTGIYTLAYQVSLVMSIVSNGIENAVTPWIYESIKRNEWKAIKKRINNLILLSTIPFVFIMFLAPEFISIMGPSKYQEAIYVIPPVVASSYLMFINTFLVSILFYYEKNVNVMLSTSAGAIVNIILNYLLLPKVGYIIAAYTTVAGYIIIFCLNLLTVYIKLWSVGKQIYNIKLIVLSLFIIALFCIISIKLYSMNSIYRWIITAIFIVGFAFTGKKLLKYIKSA